MADSDVDADHISARSVLAV